jgi:uncharacterized membrane protein YhhN
MTVAAVSITAVLAGLLAATPAGRRSRRAILKLSASTGFVAVAVSAGAPDTAYGRWVLVALALGWIGDAALLSGQTRWFLTGLVAFLLAHLGYVAAMATQSLSSAGGLVGAGLMVPTAVAIGWWLLPHVRRAMKGPVVAYIGAISVMVVACAAAAAGLGPPEVLPGAVTFAASDIFVARHRFVSPGPENARIGLPLYYAAQIVFALSVAG